MIDFHCHLDLYPKPNEVLTTLKRNKCFVLSVTTTPMAWEGTSQLVQGIKGVHMAIGLHPELAASRHKEVDRVCELLHMTRYVGEIGVDGTQRHKGSLDIQVSIFERIIDESERLGGRILSIHSRGATELVLDILKRRVRNSIPVLHWFSGSIKEAAVATDLGCWFSVGPTMLKTKKGQALAATMPIDRVLTETDGPFTSNACGPLLPWHTLIAEESLALIWKRSCEYIQEQLTQNLIDIAGEGIS